MVRKGVVRKVILLGKKRCLDLLDIYSGILATLTALLEQVQFCYMEVQVQEMLMIQLGKQRIWVQRCCCILLNFCQIRNPRIAS